MPDAPQHQHSMENVYTRLSTLEADVSGLRERVDAGFDSLQNALSQHQHALSRNQVPYLQIAMLIVSIIVPAMFAFNAVEQLRSEKAQIQINAVQATQVEHRSQIKDLISELVNHGLGMREWASALETAVGYHEKGISRLFSRSHEERSEGEYRWHPKE